jgi:hypothetical protein
MWRKTNSSSLSFFQLLHIPDYINLGHTLRLPLFWIWHCIIGDSFLMFWDCCPMKQHHTQEQKPQLHYYKKLKTHVGNFSRLHSVVLWHSNISTCTAIKHNKLLLNSSVIKIKYIHSSNTHINTSTKHPLGYMFRPNRAIIRLQTWTGSFDYSTFWDPNLSYSVVC